MPPVASAIKSALTQSSCSTGTNESPSPPLQIPLRSSVFTSAKACSQPTQCPYGMVGSPTLEQAQDSLPYRYVWQTMALSPFLLSPTPRSPPSCPRSLGGSTWPAFARFAAVWKIFRYRRLTSLGSSLGP